MTEDSMRELGYALFIKDRYGTHVAGSALAHGIAEPVAKALAAAEPKADPDGR